MCEEPERSSPVEYCLAMLKELALIVTQAGYPELAAAIDETAFGNRVDEIGPLMAEEQAAALS